LSNRSVQQRSGDVAFAGIKPVGTALAFGGELAMIETIKVNVTYTSSVAGKIVTVNPALQAAPEAIKLDPYGQGWLAVIEPSDWSAAKPAPKTCTCPHCTGELVTIPQLIQI